jgi:nickel-dependent lactate racemase
MRSYMKVGIPYGKEKTKVEIPEPYEILVPNKIITEDENKIIEKALEKPIGFESYDEFAEDADKLLVIINDATRPTPTNKILKYLLPVLSSHPDVKFLIATGVHRAPTEEEYRFIFGDTYEVFRRRTYAHDARKDGNMTYLGKSKNGTEMYINKLVTEYKNIL